MIQDPSSDRAVHAGSSSAGAPIAAFERARGMGMRTVALTGEGGGKLAGLSDHLFAVPSRSTPMIQQVHLCLYHYLCQAIECGLAAQVAGRREAGPAGA